MLTANATNTRKRSLFPDGTTAAKKRQKKEASSRHGATGKCPAAALPWQQGIIYSGGGAPTHRFNYFLTLFL